MTFDEFVIDLNFKNSAQGKNCNFYVPFCVVDQEILRDLEELKKRDCFC